MAVEFLSQTFQVHGIISISYFYAIYLYDVGSQTMSVGLVLFSRAARLTLKFKVVIVEKS